MKAYYDTCPCKGCEKRVLGCHGKCAEYTKWKNDGAEIMQVYFPQKKRRRRK